MRPVWPFKKRVKDAPTLTPPRRSPNSAAHPDFFCIGAQKSGTTWLYQHLHLHPDFWIRRRRSCTILTYWATLNPSSRRGKKTSAIFVFSRR